MTQEPSFADDGVDPPNAAPQNESTFTFSRELVTIAGGTDVRGESIRALRTNVIAQHIKLGRRALAICAASPGAGCTFIATNLAVSLSQIGLKTLLIDADMHEPGVTKYIIPRAPLVGLAQCLRQTNCDLNIAIYPEIIPNLALLPAGGKTDHAQELLGGKTFESLIESCLLEFDITVIDTPPANRCSDARRVSTVAGYSLIVAARDKTLLDDVRVLADQLQSNHATVVGTVLNDA